MSKVKRFAFGLVLLGLLGGGVFLLLWDIPAPSEPVTKTLNNDRFPQ